MNSHTLIKIKAELFDEKVEVITRTQSLCPECLKLIPAEVFKANGKVWIRKVCVEHGLFRDLYWGSYELYMKAKRFDREGRPVSNPSITKQSPVCPEDCGLCALHRGHTALANIVVTNRCDLHCWYCFFFAERAGYIYEPSLEQIRQMVKVLRNERPVPCNAIQLTGGEPTLREDLIDIIRICKEEGVDHVQLNTDGIKLCRDPSFAVKVRRAGVNTVYMSFDGTTPETNPKNHWEAPGALENCRRAGLGVVLVPTVIRTVNDHDLGGIVKFGFENIDVVRGINFQPISIVGRVPDRERERFRITIPDVISALEEQTQGEISRDDFYPVPACVPFSNFVEALTRKAEYELTNHFACGMATYVFKDDGKMIPLPRFVDIEGLLEYLEAKAEELKNGSSRIIVGAKLLYRLSSFIDKSKAPKGLSLGRIIYDALLKHNYRSLGVLHHKSLFIGMMHFQDLYNWDIERVKKCNIHYTTPDGRVIPFCVFNVIPEWYRDKIQKENGIPIEEWEKKTGRRLVDDLYRRVVPK
jgi:uncharacterized radical SAM superfamily Fe-S cluster-containing enzyme